MKNEYEPGLLAVFRVFVTIEALALAGNVVAALWHPHFPHPFTSMAIMFGLTAVLIPCFASRGLQSRLGAAFLPVALAVASAAPFAGLGVALHCSPADYQKLALELSLLTLAPLLLIAWQYGFRPAVIYAIATGALDAAIDFFALSDTRSAQEYFHFFVSRTLAFVATGYIVARLMREQRAQRTTLHQANAELARFAATRERLAVSQERNRVARELHDTLAHTLSAMAVSLEAMRSIWESEPSRAHAMLEQALSTARCGLTETRRALLALRASPLEDLELPAALVHLAKGSVARVGMTLDLDLAPLPAELPPDVEQGVYRVAQEALENAVRHSGARNVRVALRADGGLLTLAVIDDGRGFSASGAGAGRLGIRGMRERAEALGGALDVSSQEGRGTTVRVSVPIDRSEPPGHRLERAGGQA